MEFTCSSFFLLTLLGTGLSLRLENMYQQTGLNHVCAFYFKLSVQWESNWGIDEIQRKENFPFGHSAGNFSDIKKYLHLNSLFLRQKNQLLWFGGFFKSSVSNKINSKIFLRKSHCILNSDRVRRNRTSFYCLCSKPAHSKRRFYVIKFVPERSCLKNLWRTVFQVVDGFIFLRLAKCVSLDLKIPLPHKESGGEGEGEVFEMKLGKLLRAQESSLFL